MRTFYFHNVEDAYTAADLLDAAHIDYDFGMSSPKIYIDAHNHREAIAAIEAGGLFYHEDFWTVTL